ncbi:MAG TPA: hypothetical protein VFE53_06415 [Mucilaginibacter sp.]|jgi:hypothetical protein|nr:hypothetical protein [Mucilaginibacter sp.]
MISKEIAQDELPDLKKLVETSYIYFKDNCKRFREYKNYVFRECLNEQQKSLLTTLNRPQLEFNIGAANINRKIGEFSMHEPSIVVSASEGMPVDNQLIELIEGNIRHKIDDANKNNMATEIYKDMLGGGFSCGKVYTDWQSQMSMNQDIFWAKCFDSTMVGFDPLARDLHKGDGSYSFEIFPVLEEDFKQQWPKITANVKAYSYSLESFTWCYKDMHDQKVILVCDLYRKRKKKTKIVKLANGQVMTAKRYKELQQFWEDNQIIEQIPEVVSSRSTLVDVIVNYKFIQDQFLEAPVETDYCYLPHVFFDGNSEILSREHTNTQYQFTKPYFYHAKGAQDLMNFMGIAIAAHIDNLSMSQFIIKEEALPQQEDYLDNLTTPQRASTLIVRGYSENDPTKPINEPIREVVKNPLPPEVTGTFNQSAQLIQAILGSTASNPENSKDYISGKAVIEAMNVDNSAGMPYTIGYLAGLEQMARIHISLMPKYILGKRTLPVKLKDGEKIYQDVNMPGKPHINFEEGSLLVSISAGVNFQVQKNQAMAQIAALMQASPKLAEFFNSEFGLPILLDNLTIYGSDRLREAAQKWMQTLSQQQQQMMQMQQQAMQQDPRMIKAKADVAKVQLEGQELQMKQVQQEFDRQIKIAELALEQEKVQNEAIIVQHEAAQEEVNAAVQREKAQAEIISHSLDAAAKVESLRHKQKMDEHDSVRKSVELHHKINNQHEEKGDKND